MAASSLKSAAVGGVVGAFVAAGSIAFASTGPFTLGATNRVDAPSKVTNVQANGTTVNPVDAPVMTLENKSTTSSATPLALKAGANRPPMTVNSQTKVTNLNSDLLDGVDSTGFVRTKPPVTITGPGGEDVLTAKNTGNGRGLAGFSDSWQGVYGHSNSNAGVVGESLNFDGIFGVSESATHAAVSGHNDFGGWAMWAAGGDAANGTSAIHGQSAKGNGVDGVSQSGIASGVYGENDAQGYGVAGRANNGTGVLADSSSGWALNANGNATQARTKGGLVKAMVYIDPNATPRIQRCFNSQLPPAQATTVPCGFKFTAGSNGVSDVDFGFQIDDRFISISNTSLQGSGARAYSTNVVRVQEDPGSCSPYCASPAPFYLFVY